MAERQFKYRREDFGELPVTLHHLTIFLNFLQGSVEAANCLEMTARADMDAVQLDACDLEILKVEWVTGRGEVQGYALPYEFYRDEHKLSIKLPRRVKSGEKFFIRTFTRCYPSDHILEGIYKDSTPPGAPQQYMSQCQQWGFQRIMPIFDDCRAKCTMTTTLEADARYTHLISNGNISRAANPEGKPVPKPGNPLRKVITYENQLPMAPYLFIAFAGTWDTLVDTVTYESGRAVNLEYLVPPGAINEVRIPMDILKKSLLWIRETQGYEYTGDTYRTICMNKSNFGGMENVGNTTIVTDAALINEHTPDSGLLYAHAVIVHEFEHNQCGSETTMDTPFDVWLNEAYTVDVERQFMADVFNPAFMRLHQVDSIRNPLLGPLAVEDGGHAGRIVREGFNDPDELIDGVTYVKAAEVIRMLRLIIGPENFQAGKTLYFTRYYNGNADTDLFFRCFEEAAGISLESFKKGWLYTRGYPKVTATTDYDPESRRYNIHFHQDLLPGLLPFHLPIELSLVDMKGRDMKGTSQVFIMSETDADLVLEGIDEPPAFASMNRDYSFYGTFRYKNATPVTRSLQARFDPNAYNRVDAMRQLTDHERIRLLNNPDEEVSGHWLSLYDKLLSDREVPAVLKSYMLRIDEQPMDRSYSTWYRELVVAREKLMTAVNNAFRDRLLEEFNGLDTYSADAELSPRGIEERMLKNVLLDLIAIDGSPESHQLIIDHFYRAATASDRVSALLALNRGSAPSRRLILEQVYETWHTHLSGYANYLRIVSGGTQDDVFEMIEIEKKRPGFDITMPTWSRALFLPMGANNKVVWTDRGIQWVADTIIELAPINATTAGRLLNTFQHVRNLKPLPREQVRAALRRIVREVTADNSPAVHGQATAYLDGA